MEKQKEVQGGQSTVVTGKLRVVRMHPYGKAGGGLMVECLAATARDVSSTREGILTVLLTAGSLAPRSVPVIAGNQEIRVKYTLLYMQL